MKQSSHGLVRTIGRWSLTALMVNSIIGVSIFRLPSLLAEKIGAYSPLSCLAAGAGILIIAGCIAEVSSRYEETGGLYLYARDALGRFAGLLVAWLTWLTRIAAPAAAANLFCTYAAQFFPVLGTRTGELAVLAVLIGQLAVVNYIGVKTGERVSNFFTAVKVGFLLLFVIAGLVALIARPEIRVPLVWPATSARSWFDAMLLLVYAYGGFEGAFSVGGESRNPKRDTPMALVDGASADCADLHGGANRHVEDTAGRGRLGETARGCFAEISRTRRSNGDCSGCAGLGIRVFEREPAACATPDLRPGRRRRLPFVFWNDSPALSHSLRLDRGLRGAGIPLRGIGNISMERRAFRGVAAARYMARWPWQCRFCVSGGMTKRDSSFPSHTFLRAWGWFFPRCC